MTSVARTPTESSDWTPFISPAPSALSRRLLFGVVLQSYPPPPPTPLDLAGGCAEPALRRRAASESNVRTVSHLRGRSAPQGFVAIRCPRTPGCVSDTGERKALVGEEEPERRRLSDAGPAGAPTRQIYFALPSLPRRYKHKTILAYLFLVLRASVVSEDLAQPSATSTPIDCPAGPSKCEVSYNTKTRV